MVEQLQARSEQPRPVATAVVALTEAIGRPRFSIPHHQLEFLIESRFSVPQNSHILGVSISTVRRRMTDYDLSIRRTYSTLADDQLDLIIASFSNSFQMLATA